MTFSTETRTNLGGFHHRPRHDQEAVTEMGVDMAASIVWCLLGAVMVGAVVMYASMYRLLSDAYTEGRQDSLRRLPAAAAADDRPAAPVNEAPGSSAA